MKRVDPDVDGYNLSTIGQFIFAEPPNFDASTYGKAKLSALQGGLDVF